MSEGRVGDGQDLPYICFAFGPDRGLLVQPTLLIDYDPDEDGALAFATFFLDSPVAHPGRPYFHKIKD